VYCKETLPHRGEASDRPAVSKPNGDGELRSKARPVAASAPLAAIAADYDVGDLIDGRFEVLQVLGQGGFSKVYRVRDEVEGEERAFKLFDSAAGSEAVRREISALRKVQHPHVVQVFWAGQTVGGHWYLVTEYIDGESLDEYATGKRHLSDREAVDVALDVLDALVAMHPDAVRLGELDNQRRDGDLSAPQFEEWRGMRENGLVHRDIKPANVMLSRTGAKLLDFNITSRVGDPVHTRSGTPPYQPPDADFSRWDVSTDLFAVGVMLYEMLCNGHHPYPEGKPAINGEVIDPGRIRTDLDRGLAAFLRKACAPRREERFTTASEMEADLRKVRIQL